MGATANNFLVSKCRLGRFSAPHFTATIDETEWSAMQLRNFIDYASRTLRPFDQIKLQSSVFFSPWMVRAICNVRLLTSKLMRNSAILIVCVLQNTDLQRHTRNPHPRICVFITWLHFSSFTVAKNSIEVVYKSSRQPWVFENWLEALRELFSRSNVSKSIKNLWFSMPAKLFTWKNQFPCDGRQKTARQMQIYSSECWLKWTRSSRIFSNLCWFMSKSSACINWF